MEFLNVNLVNDLYQNEFDTFISMKNIIFLSFLVILISSCNSRDKVIVKTLCPKPNTIQTLNVGGIQYDAEFIAEKEKIKTSFDIRGEGSIYIIATTLTDTFRTDIYVEGGYRPEYLITDTGILNISRY